MKPATRSSDRLPPVQDTTEEEPVVPLEDLARTQAEDRLREADLARRRHSPSSRRTGSRTMNPESMTSSSDRRARAWRFARHYLEMVVAMAIGMVVLGPVWSWATGALGVSALFDRHDIGALVMATDMTIAMSAWMRYRGHGWAPIAEMGAAMYLPFVVLFIPLWMGIISGGTLMIAGHVLMLPAMALAMLLRLDEYTHDHHAHRKAGPMPHTADHTGHAHDHA